jgi:hypothetical protein
MRIIRDLVFRDRCELTRGGPFAEDIDILHDVRSNQLWFGSYLNGAPVESPVSTILSIITLHLMTPS